VTLVDVHGALLLGTLILYAVLGGADFGGGVWDLLARGPTAERQRRLIERAIAPIWEANHVWLIMAVVVLFTAFPKVFAEISIVLHIPLTALLLGIVFRGTAFALRQYGGANARGQRRWGRVFAIASTIAPVLLGVIAGSITAGRVVPGAYVASWLAAFPWLVGVFTLALFAGLAAVYLTNETTEPDLQDAFRRRALVAQLVAIAAGMTVAIAAAPIEPFGARLIGSWWTIPIVVAAVLSAGGVLVALVVRRFRVARVAAIAEVALVLAGWGLGLYPYAMPPELTFAEASAPPTTLRLLLVVILVGAVVVAPATYALMRVFKRDALPDD
jgi:cytochrome d ubiquinol oxidase subunit II